MIKPKWEFTGDRKPDQSKNRKKTKKVHDNLCYSQDWNTDETHNWLYISIYLGMLAIKRPCKLPNVQSLTDINRHVSEYTIYALQFNV